MKLPRLRVKRGKNWEAWYYVAWKDGKEKWIALGTDPVQARIKWAELEGITGSTRAPTPAVCTISDAEFQYRKWASNRAVSGLSTRTLKDREAYWKQLDKVFGHVPIDSLQSAWMLRYFDDRTAKTSAKKEIKYLSVICNWARSRGLMTASNPCEGVMRFMKVKETRDVYVDDVSQRLVYDAGDQLVRDTMDLLYICGSRPTETFDIRWSDICEGELVIRLTKTRKKGLQVKRVPIEGPLEALLERRRNLKVVAATILCDERGCPLNTTGTFRNRFNAAREKARKQAGYIDFQFRDLRAKSGTDAAEQFGMEEARRRLGHVTEKQTATYVRRVRGEKVRSLK